MLIAANKPGRTAQVVTLSVTTRQRPGTRCKHDRLGIAGKNNAFVTKPSLADRCMHSCNISDMSTFICLNADNSASA